MSISGARSPRLATEYGVATGGTETDITVSGVSYRLHTFTATGTFSVTQPGWFDVLAIAGGAGGLGAGGGAGGVTEPTTIYVSSNQTVTVGSGGSGEIGRAHV